MLKVVVFFGLIAGSFAVNYITGSCPNVTPMSPVDLNEIAGDWWSLLRDDHSWDLDATCILDHFEPPVNGVIRAVASSISISTNILSVMESNVTLTEDNILRFSHHRPAWGDSEQYQIVLDSVPDTYAIVYSCKNYRTTYVERFWVFGRNSNQSGYFTNENYLMQVLDNYGLKYPNWVKVNNENCYCSTQREA
ncbi:apolipoprotein D-like [Microplitis mediator]|uniref:apolipoprotein D-like n=1 Tax=Microplitis mediator TaxID=375433 RepID=UPI002556FD23|nr:apolipoprotein D-like [Microplitis mediator]